MRRCLCMVMALVCTLAFVGCASTSGVSEPSSSVPEAGVSQESPPTFSLPYSKEDTLNPYACTTEVNTYLTMLLYDSLTVIDGAFKPQLSLAASVTQTDVTHVTVVLRQGAKFSDGTAVTAADVKASFDVARNSKRYKELLKNVATASVDSKSGTIVFALAEGDPNVAACLCFPVLKSGKNTTEAGQAPLGGGLYVYTVEDTGIKLVANAYYGKSPRYSTVALRHLPNTSSMYYGLASGSITYYYDDLNVGETPRVSGASAKVDMNALVYLGVNRTHAVLNDPSVRQAFSLLVDRETLASSSYAGWALPATLPFHPHWDTVKQTEALFGKQDLAAAVKLLDAAEVSKKKLKLDLIYSIDSANRGALADIVRTQLESAGIQVTAVPLTYTEYLSRLQSGQYDLYIGEIRLTANMDLSPLFGGAARYGIDADGAAAQAYTRYRNAEGTLQEFTHAFGEEMPYIPLLWRCGFAGYDRRMKTVSPNGYDPYYGFVNWH